ncbi:hypothetical protein LIER_08429 [Lithospermum erythrorhizon]|uniref:Uncharacterized protein n=1 Tax=Lithospermum erythrorhizon TaxID=34254 RepID=A0AAV3PDI9_LITER
MVNGKMLSLRVLPDGFSHDDAAFLKITWDRSRTSYVRVLVVVTSFNVNLPKGENIGQKVEYELFPEFCCHCRAYGHNFFGYRVLNPPVVEVGLEPTVVPADDRDASENVCEELMHQEVVEAPSFEERFVREGFSYSEAFFSNLDLDGDSEDDTSHDVEDSEEELELVDEVEVSEEELECDEFIEVWVSFLDIPLEYTHMPLIQHV